MNKATWQKLHAEHLQSDYWFRVKREVWERDKGGCQWCGKSGRDVHHRHYKSWRRELEDLDSVILLCRKCHERAHLRHEPESVSWQDLAKRISQMGR